MKHWDVFLEVQKRYSWGGGATFVRNEAEIEKTLRFQRELFGATVLPSEGLVIGPGGINELFSLQRAGVERLHVLTTHDDEASRLRDLGIDVILGDMHDMTIPTGRFGFVYVANVMEHALAPYIALMEIRRVLVEGGLGFFVLPSFEGGEGGVGPFHLHCLTPAVWQELLHKTGFAQVDTKMFPVDASLGVTYYVGFHVRAVTPPNPHGAIFDALVRAKK